MIKRNLIAITLCFWTTTNLQAQTTLVKEDFNTPKLLHTIERGTCVIENGVLKSKDAYACFGETGATNYEIKFKARAPKEAEQVQIWAGFRAYNRNDRYIVGLKGGLSDDLFLGRLGYMGTDEFLGLRPLDFHPQPGQWYDFRIVVCENRIQIYLNNESRPRIDVMDKNMDMAPNGQITLGGSWIETEFDDLTITSLSDNHLKNVPQKEYAVQVTPRQKEEKRKAERSAYHPIIANRLSAQRTEIKLDGEWLFKPAYELDDKAKAVSLSTSDDDWHVMTVPNFWNPIRIWLHGETFGPHAKGVSDTYFQQETARCENYTFDFRKTKAAWYRQWIELPQDIKDKNLTLTFDAVSKVAEIYINGQLAGSNVGMFSEIKIDGTKFFQPGKNLIAVYVVRDFIANIEDADKVVDVAVTVPVTNKMLKDIAHGFYCEDPAGIWQPVKLEISGPLKIEDVFIKPTLTGATFDVSIKNYTNKKQAFSLNTTIADKENQALLYSGNSLNKTELNPGEERIFSYSIRDLKPKLWTPQQPNLYDFIFSLTKDNAKTVSDSLCITSGFRTFETKNGYLELNGKRYWLRGGNHTPFALAPNDRALADTFYQLMKKGNIEITRTHTTPYNELWMEAADENGIGISHEGTWPWLMIQSSMPDKELIDMWANEYLGLLKKYRNHPSLLFWTINNEMKFYDNEPDFEKAKQKMKIISDVVKRMREIDPTRPVCFDSNYRRREDKFGKAFFDTIDDGDIDDIHAYINWYDYTIFKQFNGEFQRENMNAGRPLISQEMSTGYPNSETGHPTNFYTFVHQNPQVLVGSRAFDFADPKYFLEAQCFITKELAEALRRSNDQSAGILHFALLTWFRNVYDANKIEPYPTYFGMKKALSPVLVSGELWGRHFYAGTSLPARVCVVNDLENGQDLSPSELRWELQVNGKTIASGNERIPSTRHYSRQWITPRIPIPAHLPEKRVEAQWILKLYNEGELIADNEYAITLAEKSWTQSSDVSAKKITLVDFSGIKPAFDYLDIHYTTANSVTEALKTSSDLLVFSGLDNQTGSEKELKLLRDYVKKGNNVLLLDCNEASKNLYPEYINGWTTPTEGDIVNLEIPESHVFDGIGWMDLRYFNNNKKELPTVCHTALKVNRHPNLEELTSHTKIHGYINGDMEERSEKVQSIRGTTIAQIQDNGTVTISTMSLEKAMTDPVAGRLLVNLLADLLRKK
jgi:hypothetical protein